MQFHNLTDIQQLLEPDRKVKEQRMIDFIVSKKKTLSNSTLSGTLAALWRFYFMNDVTDINWVKVRGYVGKHKPTNKDKAYTVEQIRQLVQIADLRFKVLLLLLTSSGIRIGAVAGLKTGDLTPIQNFYQVNVYTGEPEEYFTYCTPECRMYIDKYLTERRTAGETIKPESPLIREQYGIGSKARHVSTWTLINIMSRMMVRAGIRVRSHDRKRKPTMLNHGFRKFFFRQLGRSGVDPVVREFLMGHKTGNPELGVTKLMMVYDATEENDALLGYVKAIDNLTIFTENKLQMEVSELQQKVLSQDAVMEQLKKMRADLDRIKKGRS